MKVEHNKEYCSPKSSTIKVVKVNRGRHTTALQRNIDQRNCSHRSEVSKITSDAAPTTTDDNVAKPGMFQSGAAEDTPVLLVAL